MRQGLTHCSGGVRGGRAAEWQHVSVRKATMSSREKSVKGMIRRRFAETGNPATILLQRRGTFAASLVEQGVNVDNLGNLPFLPWAAFEEAVRVIVRNGGKARRGDAMRSRLGDAGLSLDSVEGHVARVVYGKRTGDVVFRRISPISAILVWAGICQSRPRELALVPVGTIDTCSLTKRLTATRKSGARRQRR